MIVSRASPNEILGKSDTTSNNTMQSPGAMLMCLIHSRNSNELEIVCSESATIGSKWLNIHFDKLHVGEPTNDTIILWILGRHVLRVPGKTAVGCVNGTFRRIFHV